MQLTPINAINCQPLKQITPAVPLREKIAFKNLDTKNTDTPPATMQDLQLEMACRIAAYKELQAKSYKEKYQSLLNNGCCTV